MRKAVLTFLVVLFTLSVLAQKKPFSRQEALQRKNNVSLTLGGNGLFLSLNYDRVLAAKPGFFVDANVGLGFIPMTGGTSFSHQLVFNLGKRTGFLMLGVGGTYLWSKSDASVCTKAKTSYHLSPIVGWKKIFRSHLLFTVYASPLIPVYASGCYNPVIPYGGASFGYTF